jgi:hypothetical protein
MNADEMVRAVTLTSSRNQNFNVHQLANKSVIAFSIPSSVIVSSALTNVETQCPEIWYDMIWYDMILWNLCTHWSTSPRQRPQHRSKCRGHTAHRDNNSDTFEYHSHLGIDFHINSTKLINHIGRNSHQLRLFYDLIIIHHYSSLFISDFSKTFHRCYFQIPVTILSSHILHFLTSHSVIFARNCNSISIHRRLKTEGWKLTTEASQRKPRLSPNRLHLNVRGCASPLQTSERVREHSLPGSKSRARKSESKGNVVIGVPSHFSRLSSRCNEMLPKKSTIWLSGPAVIHRIRSQSILSDGVHHDKRSGWPGRSISFTTAPNNDYPCGVFIDTVHAWGLGPPVTSLPPFRSDELPAGVVCHCSTFDWMDERRVLDGRVLHRRRVLSSRRPWEQCVDEVNPPFSRLCPLQPSLSLSGLFEWDTTTIGFQNLLPRWRDEPNESGAPHEPVQIFVHMNEPFLCGFGRIFFLRDSGKV